MNIKKSILPRIALPFVASALFLGATSAYAENRSFSFFSFANGSNFSFPGLFFDGQTKGELKITRTSPNDFPPSPSEFTIQKLSFDFENAPDFTASGFQYQPQTNSYTTKINNLWVFRSVVVEVTNIDPSYHSFQYKISVPTSETFVGPDLPGPFSNDVILLDGQAELVDTTPFKVVDTASVKINGKRLSIKLNGNLSSNNNPNDGMIGEGIEINMLWQGRGEKLAYIPVPTDLNIKPIAFNLETISVGNGNSEYLYSVSYEENGGTFETPRQPLQPLLDDTFISF